MAEIDFDELDKAVSSLMDVAVKKSAPKELNADTSLRDDTQPVVETQSEQPIEPSDIPLSAQLEGAAALDAEEAQSDTASEDSTLSTEKLQTPLTTKRRGQFMDMKHSSADMRSIPGPMASKPLPRVGATLAPLSSTVTLEDTHIDELDEPKSTEASTQKEEMSLLEAPEPMDEIAAVSTASDDEQGTSSTNDAVDAADTVLASPFLPDAKVEKRPLGAPVITPTKEIDRAQEDATLAESTLTHGVAIEAPASTGPIAPATVTTTLPEELHPSVLEVEADTTAATNVTDNAQRPEALASKEDTPMPRADVAKTVANDTPGTASIPPQYTAKKPAESDGPQASMYDTADHPVLTQPKKTSHWAMAIVIIILVLLGALGGAALYLYQTGTLHLV